jgi:hypothetical protein
MPSVTFTAAQPVVRQELQPLPGATAAIIHFSVTAPATQGANVRLCHLRTLNSVLHPNLPAEGRLPRESEVCELIVRNGTLTAGFSGYGGNHAKNQVKHMGAAPASFPVTLTVPFTGRQAVVAAGSQAATSDTDIAPNGQTLELVLGMEPIMGADLQPPIGWTISWDESAVEWPGAASPAPPIAPPPAPPSPPTLPPVQPPTAPPVVQQPPVVTPQGSDPRAAAIALALQLLLPNLPPGEAAALQPIIATITSGGQLNTQTILLAVLPLLLGGGR